MAATKTVQCLCQSFEFGIFDVDSDNDYDTGCTQTTTKTFAQGHDAKLVGFLVRAEMNGEEIRLNDGGMAITFQGPVLAAASVSEALAAKTQAQLDAAYARVAKRVAREASKTARKSAKAAEVTQTPADRMATVKIGRWTYEAKIDGRTNWALVEKKTGPVSVPPSKYTEV